MWPVRGRVGLPQGRHKLCRRAWAPSHYNPALIEEDLDNPQEAIKGCLWLRYIELAKDVPSEQPQ